MKLLDIQKIRKGPYKARMETLDDTECAVCEYSDREFWVYLMPGEKVEQLVFSYISGDPVPPLQIAELDQFHSESHVSRLFRDDAGYLNLNASLLEVSKAWRSKVLSCFSKLG